MTDLSRPSKWITQNIEPVADCRVFRVQREYCRREVDGKESDFFVIDTADFVNVVAVTPKNELVMVRQYRHGTHRFSWEIPGGMVDPGEDPLIAGIRELEEESGFRGEPVRIFADCAPNPAIMNNTCHFVLVENAVSTGTLGWDENEELETRLVPLPAVREMCRRGEIQHVMTLAAIFHLMMELPDAF